jgi:hypothetical protein
MPHDESRPPEGAAPATAAREYTVRPRPRKAGDKAPGEPQRSSVSLWRSPKSGRPSWSIRVVAGTSEAEVDELVRLALRAEHRLTDPEPQP